MPDAPRSKPHPANHHRFESLAVFATVVRSPSLLRVQLAFLLFHVAEIATWITILVYAYDRGGATAAGLVAFAQLAPAVVFAPVASALGDHIPRVRMLALAYGTFAATATIVAALLLTDAEPLAVYAATVLCGLAITLARPAHAAVLPTIAGTPSELTAANVASGTVESIGVLVGSVGGGIVLAAVGAGGVFVAAAVALLVGTLAVVRMRPSVATRRRRIELVHVEGDAAASVPAPAAAHPAHADHAIHSSELALAAGAGAAALPATPAGAPPGVLTEILAGIRVLRADSHTRVVVVALGLSMMLAGTLDVLGVVLALDVLRSGEETVGLIAGALGAGGLLGAGFAISLVGRPRLVTPMLVAALVIWLGIAVSGLVPVLLVALVGFLAGGVGKSVFDVAGRTMLQRVAPEETLARIFGVLEGVNMAMLALGTLAAPLLVQLLGSTVALIVAGAVVPVAALVLRPLLAGADRAGVVHEEELRLIRAIPMFSPLRVTALERLAQELDHMHVKAGAHVLREGDHGDRFYIIGSGRCEVWVKDRLVNTIGPGDGFGEIALINDVPRTATIRALEDLDLYVLDRAPFLEAVTGQSRSRAAAQELIDERLAMHE